MLCVPFLSCAIVHLEVYFCSLLINLFCDTWPKTFWKFMCTPLMVLLSSSLTVTSFNSCYLAQLIHLTPNRLPPCPEFVLLKSLQLLMLNWPVIAGLILAAVFEPERRVNYFLILWHYPIQREVMNCSQSIAISSHCSLKILACILFILGDSPTWPSVNFSKMDALLLFNISRVWMISSFTIYLKASFFIIMTCKVLIYLFFLFICF